jgi:hypothetical protein
MGQEEIPAIAIAWESNPVPASQIVRMAAPYQEGVIGGSGGYPGGYGLATAPPTQVGVFYDPATNNYVSTPPERFPRELLGIVKIFLVGCFGLAGVWMFLKVLESSPNAMMGAITKSAIETPRTINLSVECSGFLTQCPPIPSDILTKAVSPTTTTVQNTPTGVSVQTAVSQPAAAAPPAMPQVQQFVQVQPGTQLMNQNGDVVRPIGTNESIGLTGLGGANDKGVQFQEVVVQSPDGSSAHGWIQDGQIIR